MVAFFSRQSGKGRGLLPLLLMMTANSVSAEKQPHCGIKEAPDGTCEELQEDNTNLLQTHATLNHLHGENDAGNGEADNKVIGKADDKALGQVDGRADDEAAAVDEEEEKDNPGVPGSVLQTKDTYVYEELERAKATKKHLKKGPKLMTFINEHVKSSCQRPSEVISLLEYNNLRGQIEEELRRHSGKIPEHCQGFQTASHDSQQNKDENNEDWKPKYDLLLQCCEAWEKQKLEEEVETYGVDVVGPSGVVYDYLKACSQECNDLQDGCTGFVDDHSARNLLNPRECLLVEEEEEEEGGEQLASLQDDSTGDQAPGPMLDFWKKQPSQPQSAPELSKVLSFAAGPGNSFSSKGSAQNCKKITHKNKKRQKKLIKQCKAAKNK